MEKPKKYSKKQRIECNEDEDGNYVGSHSRTNSKFNVGVHSIEKLMGAIESFISSTSSSNLRSVKNAIGEEKMIMKMMSMKRRRRRRR